MESLFRASVAEKNVAGAVMIWLSSNHVCAPVAVCMSRRRFIRLRIRIDIWKLISSQDAVILK
jgi:hypothetical protein